MISKTAGELTVRMSLSESLVEALVTAVATSLPELVMTIAADVSYRDGSLYHAADTGDQFWNLTAILMTGILLGGLILRQRIGPGRIGAESLAILVVYAGAIRLQVMHGPGQ